MTVDPDLTIADRDRLATTPARDVALTCVESGIKAALPGRVVARELVLDGDRLHVGGTTYDLGRYDELVVVGGGKASGRLAVALDQLFGDRLDRGAVVAADPAATGRVEVLVGNHPVPGKGSVAGARRVLEVLEGTGERTLVLALITGGGSALMAAPAGDLVLPDLRTVTEALLESGAAINEINAVRKHCSAVKGGRLAMAAAPATVVGLVMSDVVGDNLEVIASGPTAPDPTTYAEAMAVLDRYEIEAPAVREHLERGTAGDLYETPGPGASVFERVSNHIIAGAHTALDAAREAVRERGYEPLMLSARIRGEAREAALTQAAIAEEVLDTGDPVGPPAAVLSGGETTVAVRGDGRGGPNLEFSLGAAMELPEGAVLVSVDTDGRDGSTDAAGAIVDTDTVDDSEAARDALAANDVYPYLDERDVLVRTGSTGTNVNDLRVLLVGRD